MLQNYKNFFYQIYCIFFSQPAVQPSTSAFNSNNTGRYIYDRVMNFGDVRIYVVIT